MGIETKKITRNNNRFITDIFNKNTFYKLFLAEYDKEYIFFHIFVLSFFLIIIKNTLHL